MEGPIAGISVGMVDGELILNPNAEQRHKSDLNLTVCRYRGEGRA